MPVQGPEYSESEVEDIYNKVMNLLKENNIQKHSPQGPNSKEWEKLRKKRNKKLHKAIESLIELNSWENF